MLANHKDNKFLIKSTLVECKRGQIARSLSGLAKEFGWTVKKVRGLLSILESNGMISVKKGTVTSVITICNYEDYQQNETDKGTTGAQQGHSEGTTGATNNNVNNDNNENNDNKSLVPASRKPDKFSDGDMDFVDGMLNLLLQSNPKFKKPNKKTWAEDVRKIRVIDGIDHKEMARVFTWANKDQFWSSNILSPGKLRKQWNQLSAKANQHQSKGGLNNRDASNVDMIGGDY